MTEQKIIIILRRTQNVNAHDLQASSLHQTRKTIIVTLRQRWIIYANLAVLILCACVCARK